jgi:hypothetical protein
VRRSAARCIATNAAAPRADAAARGQGEKPQTSDRHCTFQGTQERQESSPKEALRADGERDHGGGGAVNFKTANRGIEIPASILLRAEKVIE